MTGSNRIWTVSFRDNLMEDVDVIAPDEESAAAEGEATYRFHAMPIHPWGNHVTGVRPSAAKGFSGTHARAVSEFPPYITVGTWFTDMKSKGNR